ERTSRGTVEASATPSTSSKPSSRSSSSRTTSVATSSPVRSASVATRQCSTSSSPSKRPSTVWVLPTSTASNIRLRAFLGEVVVAGERLAELLGQGLGREGRLLALAAQLLDRDVARGVDLGARDHAHGAILVPHPHVLHRQVEERVARLRQHAQLVPVAEVGRVLGDDAEAEESVYFNDPPPPEIYTLPLHDALRDLED